jgi:anti-sigma factor RsiW
VTATLCSSIETLAMAYLDDELAGEERRELETHIIDCAACRQHLEVERADLELVRAKLVAPPAPDLVHARIARALDAEDLQRARAARRRWSSYLLPAGASAVAVAALVAFVAVKPHTVSVDPVAAEVARLTARKMPLEVQGAANVAPWLHEHFMPDVEVPQFGAPGIRLVGARLTAVNGHDAALLVYDVSTGETRFGLSGIVIRDISADEMTNGTDVQVGNRTLHVIESNDGWAAVTFVDRDHTGYAFIADRLRPDELVRLVVSSDLIDRAQRGR